MDRYFFILTTIDLFVLGFMCLLTRLSESLNKKQKRGFLLAFALIACISVLEVITIVVDGAPPGYRWLNILSNYLGFGLTPAVPLCLVYVLDKKSIIRRIFKAAVCCEGAYLLFLAATLPYGLVFSVSRENLYARGAYFYIYVAMYYAAMLYLMVATVRTAAAFQNRSRMLIYPLTLFLGAETVIQLALPELHVTWLCVTLLSVLYYIYCSEMWNQLDALTGLLNQNSYLNRTAEMRRSGGVLVVFDVDDFKQINDRYGHLQGDVCLAEIADCIKKAYARCGYCYESRLALTCAIASENGFDCFTTSLLYSRHQQHDAIRGIGTRVAASGDYRTDAGFGSEFLYRDFRPLWQAGIDRSKEMGLYRQNYCACIFSEYERFEKKLRKL